MNFVANPIYIEWINNKTLLYSMGNNSQYPIINHNRKEYEKNIYTHIIFWGGNPMPSKGLEPSPCPQSPEWLHTLHVRRFGLCAQSALAIQVPHGKHCHRRKLYVNPNNRLPRGPLTWLSGPRRCRFQRRPLLKDLPEPLLVHSSLLRLLASPVRQRNPRQASLQFPWKWEGPSWCCSWGNVSEMAGWPPSPASAGRWGCWWPVPSLRPPSSGPCTSPTLCSRLCMFSRTCRPFSAPWPRRSSRRPTCTTWRCSTGPAVWRAPPGRLQTSLEQVQGAGPRGLLGSGHIRGFWPVSQHPGAVPAQSGQWWFLDHPPTSTLFSHSCWRKVFWVWIRLPIASLKGKSPVLWTWESHILKSEEFK